MNEIRSIYHSVSMKYKARRRTRRGMKMKGWKKEWGEEGVLSDWLGEGVGSVG